MTTTTRTYQVKYNRATNHIAGLDEATKSSTDGMTYSLSACGALSKGLYLANGFASDDLAAVLDNARKSDRKLCKNCEKAALRVLATIEQDAAAEATQEVAETAEAPKAETTSAAAPKAVEVKTGKRYGKAQARVLAYAASHAGQTVTVAQMVRDLNGAGEKTWFNATNTALKALAADPESGITEVEGGNKAYKFQ